MLMDNGRNKPAKTEKTLPLDSTKNLGFLPTLSNYDQSSSLLIDAIRLAPSIGNIASKLWKLHPVSHFGFFVGSASVESIISTFLLWLYANEYLSNIALWILLITLYVSLVISCFIFLAKLAIEGKKIVSEKIKFSKNHSKRKRKSPNKEEVSETKRISEQ
jgi:hypothetical protein